MNNWLLIIVGVIFLVSIVSGAVRGFFKIGISLLASVLTVVLMLYLSPHIGKVLTNYTPLDEMIQEKCLEAFMPEISAETFEGVDLSGTPLEGLSSGDIDALTELDWDRMGMTPQEILSLLGEIPREQQIESIEDSMLPDTLKDKLLENNNSEIYERLRSEEHTSELSHRSLSRMPSSA